MSQDEESESRVREQYFSSIDVNLNGLTHYDVLQESLFPTKPGDGGLSDNLGGMYEASVCEALVHLGFTTPLKGPNLIVIPAGSAGSKNQIAQLDGFYRCTREQWDNMMRYNNPNVDRSGEWTDFKYVIVEVKLRFDTLMPCIKTGRSSSRNSPNPILSRTSPLQQEHDPEAASTPTIEGNNTQTEKQLNLLKSGYDDNFLKLIVINGGFESADKIRRYEAALQSSTIISMTEKDSTNLKKWDLLRANNISVVHIPYFSREFFEDVSGRSQLREERMTAKLEAKFATDMAKMEAKMELAMIEMRKQMRAEFQVEAKSKKDDDDDLNLHT